MNAPTGCNVPVQVSANGIVSNAVTIAIDKAGGPCSDSFNPLSAALFAGGPLGIVTAERIDAQLNAGPDPPGEVTDDFLLADLQQDPGGSTYFYAATSLPPLGTCTMYAGGAFDEVASTLLYSPYRYGLDGGSALEVTSGSASASVGQVSHSELYTNLLGQQPTPPEGAPLLFTFPGTFTLTIPGGANVQAAQIQGTTPTPLAWTNRDSLSTVTRANGLTVTWTGGNPATDVVLIGVLANNDAANSAALAVCVTAVTAGSFTIPAQILGTLPATPANATRTPAWVGIAAAPFQSPGAFSAGGLNLGFLVPSAAFVNAVVVQ